MGRPWPATNCSRSGGSGARHVHAGICMVHQLYFAKYRSGLSQTPRPTSILNCTTANRLIYIGPEVDCIPPPPFYYNDYAMFCDFNIVKVAKLPQTPMGELTALPYTTGKAPPPLVSSTLIVSRTPPSPDQPTGLHHHHHHHQRMEVPSTAGVHQLEVMTI